MPKDIVEPLNSELESNGIAVLIEHGPDFHPSSRLKAAMEELSAALETEELAEVSGFTQDSLQVGLLKSPMGDPLGIKFPITICSGWRIGCDGKVVIKGGVDD
jgi:hypothetical protein